MLFRGTSGVLSSLGCKPDLGAHMLLIGRWDNPRSGVFKRFMTVRSRLTLPTAPFLTARSVYVYIIAAYGGNVCDWQRSDKVQGGLRDHRGFWR